MSAPSFDRLREPGRCAVQILVLNSGSSSVKFAVMDPATNVRPLSGLAERLGGAEPGRLHWQGEHGAAGEVTLRDGSHDAAIEAIVAVLRAQPGLWDRLAGVGHRLVHGGEQFTASVLIDDAVVAGVEAMSHLAPLHNPVNLLGVAAARARFPHLPQVGVFDTAFHQTMPPRAFHYAVPQRLYRELGVRRYGFHGTSHRYVTAQAAALLGKPVGDLALITAHLGNGCSAAAVLGGRSVDTTMGLTPLEGLVMGTRSGTLDPGLHAFLADRLGLDVHGVTRLLNKESGLLGLSDGLASDMRSLSAAAAEGHAGARLAIEVFVYRLAKEIMGLTVALGRLDALVFTGGIGEHSAAVRAGVLDLVGPLLGLPVDAARNAAHGADSQGRITADGARVALVVPTDEERLIAQDAAGVIAAHAAEAARHEGDSL